MPPKLKFAEGEKLLSFSQGLIYDAKCLKTSVEGDEIQYLVHYVGWKKRYDEWVPEDNLLKYNNENVRRQRKLREEKEAERRSKKNAKRKTKAKTTSPSEETDVHNVDEGSEVELKIKALENSGASKRKQVVPKKFITKAEGSALKQEQNDAQNYAEEASVSASDMPLHAKEKHARNLRSTKVEALPEESVKLENPPLPNKLVQLPYSLMHWSRIDREMITLKKKIVNLPAVKNIQEILEDFVTLRSDIPEQENEAREFANAVIMFFDDNVEQYLYPSEVDQFTKIVKSCEEGTVPSKIYGVTHLLRMFEDMDDLAVLVPIGLAGTFYAQLDEFLRFLEKDFSRYFQIANYIEIPSASEKN